MAEKIRSAHGVKVEVFRVDLSNRQDIENFWDNLEITPDILVKNAGIYQGRTFDKADQKFIDNMMQVNLGAVMQMCPTNI